MFFKSFNKIHRKVIFSKDEKLRIYFDNLPLVRTPIPRKGVIFSATPTFETTIKNHMFSDLFVKNLLFSKNKKFYLKIQ